MQKVIDYYAAKDDKSDYSMKLDQRESLMVPLFQSLNEPSVDNVGYLIDLKCGHTQRPTELESIMFTVHLEAAGFATGKVNRDGTTIASKDRDSSSKKSLTPHSPYKTPSSSNTNEISNDDKSKRSYSMLKPRPFTLTGDDSIQNSSQKLLIHNQTTEEPDLKKIVHVDALGGMQIEDET